jgi:hypothetical protein
MIDKPTQTSDNDNRVTETFSRSFRLEDCRFELDKIFAGFSGEKLA